MIIFAVFTERGELKPPVVSGNVIVEDRDDTYKNGMATVHHRESGASQNTQAFMFSKGQWHCYAVTAQLCMLSGQPKICRPLCFLKVHSILSSSAMFVFCLWWNHLRTVSGCFVFKVSLMVSFQGQSSIMPQNKTCLCRIVYQGQASFYFFEGKSWIFQGQTCLFTKGQLMSY